MKTYKTVYTLYGLPVILCYYYNFIIARVIVTYTIFSLWWVLAFWIRIQPIDCLVGWEHKKMKEKTAHLKCIGKL